MQLSEVIKDLQEELRVNGDVPIDDVDKDKICNKVYIRKDENGDYIMTFTRMPF